MNDCSNYLIIGNDKLSKSIRKKEPGIHHISSRAMLTTKTEREIISQYRKIIVSGQVTRRMTNDPIDILSFNTRLAAIIADYANCDTNIVFISSIDVFGKSANMPLTSNTGTSDNHLDDYTTSKILSEDILRNNHSGPLDIIRCAGLYGYSTLEGSIVSRMFMSAYEKNIIHLTDKDIERPILSYNYCSSFVMELLKNNGRSTMQSSYTIGPQESIKLGEIAGCISRFFRDNYGSKVTIDYTSDDTSGGRDKVIETSWGSECLQYGHKRTEVAEDAINLALSAFAKEINMLK